jgi:uncharacterized protein
VARVRAFALTAVVASLAVACSRGQDFGAARVVIRGAQSVSVRAAVARTEADREHGLMGVRELPPDAGMAFLLDRPTTRGFWMKDTLVPLSVAFWDSSGRIVAILDMTPCRRDPCRIYEPGREYVGALELARGYLVRHGVRVGDVVRVAPGSS